MVYVGDLVRGMADLLESPTAAGETYFVGTPGYSWAEVRTALETALGRKTLTLPVPGTVIRAVGAVAERVGGALGTLPPLTADKAEAGAARLDLRLVEGARRRRLPTAHEPGRRLRRDRRVVPRAHGWL